MEKEVVKIDPHTETICCDGGQDGLGHPAVYSPLMRPIKSFVVTVVKLI